MKWIAVRGKDGKELLIETPAKAIGKVASKFEPLIPFKDGYRNVSGEELKEARDLLRAREQAAFRARLSGFKIEEVRGPRHAIADQDGNLAYIEEGKKLDPNWRAITDNRSKGTKKYRTLFSERGNVGKRTDPDRIMEDTWRNMRREGSRVFDARKGIDRHMQPRSSDEAALLRKWGVEEGLGGVSGYLRDIERGARAIKEQAPQYDIPILGLDAAKTGTVAGTAIPAVLAGVSTSAVAGPQAGLAAMVAVAGA